MERTSNPVDFRSHPANVLVLTDTSGSIRRQFWDNELWQITSDATVLSERLWRMKRVHAFVLYDTNVDDISALRVCSSLECLHLEGTLVTNVDALGECTSLRKLHLTDTKVTNVDALKTCTWLEELYIQGTLVTDTTALSHLVARGLRIIK